MKIRNGFVSNSSSSSFLIYGVEVEDVNKLIEGLNLTDKEKESLEEEGDWHLSEILEDKNLKGLEYMNAYDGECHYLGRSWDSVGDNETGLEFKNTIQKKISKLLGEDTECGTISESWYG